MESTRIADLPENISMSNMPAFPPEQYTMGRNAANAQMPSYSANIDIPNTNVGGKGANYMQMNVHPNPYGQGPPKVESIGLPQQTHTTKPSNNPYISQGESQYQQQPNMPVHRLPSRDIPHDTTSYSHDEEITPNYIPSPKLTSEFVKDYEDAYAKTAEQSKRQKRVVRTIDDLFLEIRIPIVVALLFMVFQSPFFHTTVFKQLSFLGVYGPDGNVNMMGLVVKSALFGLGYYALDKVVDYIR